MQRSQIFEFLIVSILGLILIASIFQIYLSVKAICKKGMALAEMQENMRSATLMLPAQIRLAGYAGCINLRDLKRGDNFVEHGALNINFDTEHSLYGFSAADAPDYLRYKIRANTDGIVVLHAAKDVTHLVADAKHKAAVIYVEHNPALLKHDILLITDCSHADLFRAMNFGDKIIRLASGGLAHSYKRAATEVARFTEITYFISNTERRDTKGRVIKGLFQSIDRGHKEELLAAVSDMQIFYGILGNFNTFEYLRASEVRKQNAWSKVKSVMLRLTFDDVEALVPSRSVNFYIGLRER